jgi:gamma-glutamylcyclotransferase (GGCT)/AIG2-like uncharacterized protein YtfP
MLYYAYGANTNIKNMEYRCPNATLVGNLVLPDWKLVFRGVADIERSPDRKVLGILWDITEDCERALDIFEGYPNLYRKEYFDVKIGVDIDGEVIEQVMFYKMNRQGYGLPSESYFRTIESGYRQNKLDTDELWETLAELA